MEANQELGLNGHIPWRENLAGVHLDAIPLYKITYHIEMANPIEPEEITEICLKPVHIQEGSLSQDEQNTFLHFRESLNLLEQTADENRIEIELLDSQSKSWIES
jgi:hypothetical protein